MILAEWGRGMGGLAPICGRHTWKFEGEASGKGTRMPKKTEPYHTEEFKAETIY